MCKTTMSEPQHYSSSSSRTEERSLTPDILISESDERLFRSLEEFIEQEKRYLKCPEQGPDELRYIVYSCVFNKVIGRATAYKRLLLTIKTEYDDVVRELQRREDEARAARRTLAASTSLPKSVITCQRRAAHLRDRICVVQRETTELQEEMKRQKPSEEQSMWIPGLTVAESEDPEALDGHMKHLEAQRASLLERKSRCVSLEVKAQLHTELHAELQASEHRRDQLSSNNHQLKVLYKRLRLVSDLLSSWEHEEQQIPLEELLGSTLEDLRQTSVTDDEGRIIVAELFEHEEPTGIDESKHLADHLDRFIELFDSAQYEDAAFLAARSPRGVLRNLDTMEMFQGVKGPLGSPPPLLLFLQALLMTTSVGEELPAALSLQLVHCALRHGATQLVTHAFNNNKLTFSEDLGDVLTEHAQKNPGVADVCLAFATNVYEACRLDRKTALSMCRRGLIHSAADFMNHCDDLTAEDCLWVLCLSPSLVLLQLLTAPQQGRAAILSVSVSCSTLLADPQQQQLALQLLDSFVSGGRGALEDAILQDRSASVDVWDNVASRCSELNRADLSRAVLSVLLDQSGTRVLTPALQGGRLMEHVFL
ncbi:clathrin heavy chain linker domain-containing protein 1-like isoform X2 [Cottoperca gobio]|uniref:Clathrin heavy chain linker domain-containing protein 1-like isoform X2 n=1 Tax=Cottoperca gobio TaxID=56716 RepID=A0A6J2RAR0_COTGO|nr:clathrin heavy chain linker domain-containing protein 1 isoform X2 [Cottoperca gobio]